MVLALLAVVAVMSVGALHDALFGEQLATTRQLHQRAAALAELGIQHALARLTASSSPEASRFALQPLSGSEDSVSLSVRTVGGPLPTSGHSMARFSTRHFEIESTAHTARGTHATHVQGIVQVVPLDAVDPESGGS